MLIEFLPIIVFFGTYKLAGVFWATASAIACSAIEIIYLKAFRKQSPTITQWITFGAITVLGGATLLLQDPLFIQWKTSIVYWVLAGVFFFFQWKKESLIEKMMGAHLKAPKIAWLKVNFSWALFFTFLGALNLWVVYHYDTDTWVHFKLYGILGLTLLFTVGQTVYLSQYRHPN